MYKKQTNLFYRLAVIVTVTIGAAFLNFLLQVLYAKNLSIEEYGRVSLYLNFITLIMPIVGSGLPSFWIKANAKKSLHLWIKPSIKFIEFTFIFSLLLQLIFISIYVKEDFLAYVLLSTFIISQVSIDLINAINLINKDTKQYAFWRMFSSSLRLILLIFLIILDKVTVLNIGLLYLVTTILPFLKIRRVLESFNIESSLLEGDDLKLFNYLDVLKNCWMYSMSGVLYLVYLQSNVIILGKYYSLKDAALFNVPVLIITVALMFPNIIFQKFFAPDLNNWFYNDISKFREFFRKANFLMFFLGLLLSMFLYVIAPVVVDLFFGKEFIASVEIIRILVFLIPFAFLTSGFSSIHIRKSDLKIKVLIMFIVALLHISLVYFLQKYAGIKGFAYSTVISYIIVSCLFYLSSNNIVKGVRMNEI